MIPRGACWIGLVGALLLAARVQAWTEGDVLVADASRRLVAVDPDTGAQSVVAMPPIGTGQRSVAVGVERGGPWVALAVTAPPNVPLTEIHLARPHETHAPLLTWTVPDVIGDVDGSSSPLTWLAAGDRLWALYAVPLRFGWVGVARPLADIAGPARRATSLRLYERDDGGGGRTWHRVLIAAGSAGVLSWNPDTGTLSPFGGSPPSPTPPNDLVWAVDDWDDSLLTFGTTQLELAGSRCGAATGFLAFALLGFGPVATGGLLQCALGLAFADGDTAYATAIDDLFVGGNPRVVRIARGVGGWTPTVLASGPPLSAPIDVEVVPAIRPTITMPACERLFAVNDSDDQRDAAPGDGLCANVSNRCTLRAAVMEANAVVGRDCIVLPPGTFRLALAGREDDAESGDLDLRDEVLIAGAGIDATVIDAGGIDRVFDVPVGGSAGGTRSVVLQRLTARGGQEVEGGGIRAEDTLLVLEEVALRENVAEIGSGGAIYLGPGSAATIRRSVLADNRGMHGSAISTNGGALAVEDSTLSGHGPDVSVGSSVISAPNAPSVVVRSTFTRNDAGSDFFSCVVEANGTESVLHNVTFSGNRRGRVACGRRLTLWNTTIALHESSPLFFPGAEEVVALLDSAIAAPVGGGAACGAPLRSRGGNVDPDGTCIGDGPGDRPATPARLGPLADHGGPTRTHAPRAGSPLLDGGRAATCAALDQRREPRPVDGDGDGEARCDVGAVEFVPESREPAIAALVGLALLGRRAARRASTARGGTGPGARPPTEESPLRGPA